MGLTGASLNKFVVNSGLSPDPSGAVPEVYGLRRTVLGRTAKFWDSPRAGTVPALLPS